MNFARLNHILIPTTREERERLRRGRWGWLFRPIAWLLGALSDEGRALALLLLFVGAAGLEVNSTQVHLLWAALAGVLLASLIVRSRYRLADVQFEVKSPRRVAAGERLSLTLTLYNEGDRACHAIRVRGPFLPWDGSWLSQVPKVATLQPGERLRLEVKTRFVQRGHHHLDPFTARALVPFGLVLGPRLTSADCRFVVVPHLARVAAISLPMARSYQPGGIANASTMGEAMELVGVRPYRPGDPVRDLHPRTWARTGIPHIKEFQQEYFTRIGIIVDNEREALTEDGFEALISLAAGVVARLTQGEALIDLVVLGGQIHSFTIGRALGSVDQALDILACAEPGDSIEPGDLVARLEPHLSRLSAIIIVTQSDDPSRLELADAVKRRGVSCRVLRVQDDLRPLWMGGRQEAIPARHEVEKVVLASAIRAGETLVL